MIPHSYWQNSTAQKCQFETKHALDNKVPSQGGKDTQLNNMREGSVTHDNEDFF